MWDPTTKQIFSTDEADINTFLCEDDAQNLSDEPTAMKETSISNLNIQVEFQVPDVEITGEKPAMYEEDSVSTFRSHAQGKSLSANEKMSVSFSQPIVIDKTAGKPSSVSHQIPSAVHDVNEDGSVSRMSDSMIKISMLEDQFMDLESHVTEAIQELKDQQKRQQDSVDSLIAFLRNQAIFTNPNATPSTLPAGSQTTTSSDQANHPVQMTQAGGSHGAAGTGS